MDFYYVYFIDIAADLAQELLMLRLLKVKDQGVVPSNVRMTAMT